MDTQAIRKAAKAALAEYDVVGLRVLADGHDGHDCEVGDVMPCSYPWEDGEQVEDADPLDGCSAINVSTQLQGGSGDRLEDAVRQAGDYFGDRLVMVAGYYVTRGEDRHEVVIRDAVVVAVFDI